MHFGSRTQAVVALSSAESEFYAIGTGATEALHLKNFLGEILTNKINLTIHTDVSSGKSMATRIGVSKRAKHIELRYMFIQHLIHDGILSIHKINTKHNPADILTKYVTREVLQWHFPDPANLVNLVFRVIYFSSSNYFTLSSKYEKKQFFRK